MTQVRGAGNRALHAVRLILVSLLSVVVLLTGTWGRMLTPGISRASSSQASATAPPLLKPDRLTPDQVSEAYNKLPLSFIENRGQVDARVAYYVQGRDTNMYFTPNGITLTMIGQKPLGESVRAVFAQNGISPPSKDDLSGPDRKDGKQRWIVKLDFVGANADAKISAEDQTDTSFNYFTGPKNRWQTALKSYATLRYTDLWPGIDLVYNGTVNQLKYTFIVKPGADPQQIRLAYRGVSNVRLNDAHQLEIVTPVGSFRDEEPYAYQETEGQRTEVAMNYDFKPGFNQEGVYSYGFNVGEYDRTKPLVLDPVVMVYCGYIGGTGDFNIGGQDDEIGYGIAVDDDGSAYVTGFTGSAQASFPDKVGPDQTWNGGLDAFVAKVKPDGRGLVYCGYIGGSKSERGQAIALDGDKNAYVTGRVSSSEADGFPVTVGPDLTYNGSEDAFVAKISADGTSLIYCGYIGGNDEDIGYGIAVDSTKHAYIAGITFSTEATFPVHVGPDMTFNGGIQDGFVAKLSDDGSALVYCGYIGGSGDGSVNDPQDACLAIAVDSSNTAFVTGYTGSTEATFPVKLGPDTMYNGGDNDAFIARVSVSGASLVYCGYIGGAGAETGSGIAVDSAHVAYVVGTTNSSQATFPVKLGPDTTYNGSNDAFVAKVDTTPAIVYCGYIGGTDGDNGLGIAIDKSKRAIITGQTFSTEAQGFPLLGGLDATFNGGLKDAFVAKVISNGAGLVYSAYIGGDDKEAGNGIAVDRRGNAYITGVTRSTQATFPVRVGPDLTFNSGALSKSDAFVAMVCDIGCADLFIRKQSSPNPVNVGNNLTYFLTTKNNGPGTATNVNVIDILPQSVTYMSAMPGQGSCSFSNGHVSCTLGTMNAGQNVNITIVVTPNSAGKIKNTAAIKGDQPDPNILTNLATNTTTVN